SKRGTAKRGPTTYVLVLFPPYRAGEHADVPRRGPDAHEEGRDRSSFLGRSRPVRPVPLRASGDRRADGRRQGEARVASGHGPDRGVLPHPDEVETGLVDPRNGEGRPENLGRHTVGGPLTRGFLSIW